MKGAGRERIISGRVFLVIVGDVFFPGNHKTVVIYFGDLYARKAFSSACKVGKLPGSGCFFGKVRHWCDGKIKVMRRVFRYLIIFGLIDGSANA